ncbi:hypothetical protein [Lactobacillus crispatus]|uniref:hypothetical protein n=1 Tax=Lactobacillus crispatus TaxID=47770 RepID=UPI001E484C64|nr:hypothetical protein [Lactobacillus crispatus]
MKEFDEQFHPKTIEERYQSKYINEVWQYLLKNKRALKEWQKLAYHICIWKRSISTY